MSLRGANDNERRSNLLLYKEIFSYFEIATSPLGGSSPSHIVGGIMQAFELAELISQRESSNKLYLEFLKVPDLSMGLYILPAGGVDAQLPHTEDEIYYVVSGRAQILVADENRDVQAGSIIYVAKNIAHRFHSIEEELTLLVFFAPAEYSNKQ